MSETKSNTYDKMPDFIESVFNVFQLINRKSQTQNDKRFKMISHALLSNEGLFF